MRIGSLLIAGLLGCKGCLACHPGPVQQDTSVDSDSHDDDSDSADSDTDLVDTAPAPPCPQPETEPNGLDAPNPIAMETYACGEFQTALDADAFSVDVPSDGWLLFRVDARSIGSFADPLLVLSSDDGQSAQAYMQDDGFEDPFLLFPATASTWTMLVGEETGAGGPDDYEYRLLVASAKPPVSWNLSEREANDSQATAQALGDGDLVLGTVSAPTDRDWYEVRLPAGSHTVTFSVDAMKEGSAGDFTLRLYDASGTSLASTSHGEEDWEHDPWLAWSSTTSQDLYVRVDEAGGRGGEAYWYLLGVTVEGN